MSSTRDSDRPSVIALIGPMRSGKDTIFEELNRANAFGGVKRIAFADAVKQSLGDQLGISVREVEARKHKLRPELQKLGKEKREQNPDHWVDISFQDFEFTENSPTIVVTDCRYLNEAWSILNIHKSLLVRVDTPSDVRFDRYIKDYPEQTLQDFHEISTHDSEVEWQYCPHHLRFSGVIPKHKIADEFVKTSNRVTPESLVVPQPPRKRPLIYISGPISHGNTFHHIHRAIEAWHYLWELNYTPICPHINGALEYHTTRDYEEWMDYDLEMLRQCDMVYRLEGFSPGADREVAEAKRLGIRVVQESEPIRGRVFS